MYLCICNDITDKDLKEHPELADQIGSICGACISDGPAFGFDGAGEQLVDNSVDHDTIE